MGSHLIIDSDRCIGCGQCVQVCIRDNLSVEDGKAVETGGPCVDCVQCEAVCPQHLKIRGLLKQVSEVFEQVPSQ